MSAYVPYIERKTEHAPEANSYPEAELLRPLLRRRPEVRSTTAALGLIRRGLRAASAPAPRQRRSRSGESLPEDNAYGLFVDFRWADNGGDPYCPRCGCLEPYNVRRVVSGARRRSAAPSSR
ncbi:transposase (plasmid) [Rhizobium sp. 007]|nr:transposase [Rhizobium sp. 007]